MLVSRAMQKLCFVDTICLKIDLIILIIRNRISVLILHKFHAPCFLWGSTHTLYDFWCHAIKTLGIDMLDEICQFIQAEVKTRLHTSVTAAEHMNVAVVVDSTNLRWIKINTPLESICLHSVFLTLLQMLSDIILLELSRAKGRLHNHHGYTRHECCCYA